MIKVGAISITASETVTVTEVHKPGLGQVKATFAEALDLSEALNIVTVILYRLFYVQRTS